MKLRKNSMKQNFRLSAMTVYMVVFCALVFVFVLGVTALAGQETGQGTAKVPFKVPRVKAKAHVDGVLNEDLWQEALKLEINYEVHPGENITPPVKTEVFLAYNKTYIYIGFRAYDPDPTAIRATVHDRDKMGTDDWVGVAFDTFNDSRHSYNFFCNPYGIQSDSIISPGGGGEQWDGIWHSAGKITAQGYEVEMAIPFSSIRFQNTKNDQVWGVDTLRSYPRNVRHLIGLFPRNRNNDCYLCQAEKMIGFSGASAENLELDPTFAAHLTQQREAFPDGKFIEKESAVEPGLTARWGFTSNLTLAAAANPDFSNVEADIAKLEINKQFAIFYPEKRPFFLEGAGIFTTRYLAVYSRALADPTAGIKLTGKEGPHTIGFFSVHDNLTNLLIPGSQNSSWTSLDCNTLGSAVRYRRDIGKASNIGLLISDREGTDYFNRLAGLDGSIRITPTDRVLFQFLGSQSHYPDNIVTKYVQPDGNFWGSAWNIFYYHDSKTFDWFLDYQDISGGFRADLGFMPQVDYRYISGGAAHTWRRNPGFWYTVFNIGAICQQEKDHEGGLLARANIFRVNYNGPAQSFFNMDISIGRRGFLGSEFRENYITGNAGFQPAKPLVLSLEAKFGDQIDITNIQPGKVAALTPTLNFILGTHLELDLGHSYEKLNVAGGKLYTANLSNLKLVYQFNKRTFLRAILQFANHRFNSALYAAPVAPKYQHLFSQVLFSYKINPQTVLFLGYSDDYYGFQWVTLTQNNRTFFVKLGYALRL